MAAKFGLDPNEWQVANWNPDRVKLVNKQDGKIKTFNT